MNFPSSQRAGGGRKAAHPRRNIRRKSAAGRRQLGPCRKLLRGPRQGNCTSVYTAHLTQIIEHLPGAGQWRDRGELSPPLNLELAQTSFTQDFSHAAVDLRRRRPNDPEVVFPRWSASKLSP